MMEEEGKREPPAHRRRLLSDLRTRQCFLVKLVTVCVIVEAKRHLAKENPNPVPPPWAQREWRDAVGPPHVEQIAWKRRERQKASS